MGLLFYSVKLISNTVAESGAIDRVPSFLTSRFVEICLWRARVTGYRPFLLLKTRVGQRPAIRKFKSCTAIRNAARNTTTARNTATSQNAANAHYMATPHGTGTAEALAMDSSARSAAWSPDRIASGNPTPSR
jgi:hypothetical protein